MYSELSQADILISGRATEWPVDFHRDQHYHWLSRHLHNHSMCGICPTVVENRQASRSVFHTLITYEISRKGQIAIASAYLLPRIEHSC